MRASPSRREVAWLLTGLIGYGAALLAILTLVFTGLTRDDLEVVYYAQGWRFHSFADHPPLYAWLAQALVAVLGPTPLATGLLKVGGLLAAYGLIWLAVRRLSGSAVPATIAAAGLPASLFFGYMAIHNYTHTVLMLAAMAGLFCAAVHLLDDASPARPTWPAALGVGGAVSVGLLAKLSFPFFAAIFLAVLPWRRLTDRQRRTVAMVALAAASPGLVVLLVWLATAPEPLMPQLAVAIDTEREVGLGPRVVGIVNDAVLTPLLRLLPGLLVPFLVAPMAWRWRSTPGEPAERAETCRAWADRLALYGLLSVALVVLGAVLSGGAQMREHYLAPVLVLVPTWLALRLGAAGVGAARLRRAALALGGIAGAYLLAAPIVVVAVSPGSCGRCLANLPVEAIGRQIAEEGFRGGTIVTDWLDWGANLRRVFPEARLVAEYHPMLPRPPGQAGGCLVLTGNNDIAPYPPRLSVQMTERFGVALPVEAVPRRASAPLAYSDDRTVELTYFLFPDGLGDCR